MRRRPRRPYLLRRLALAAALLLSIAGVALAAEPPRIAAAANVKPALDEIVARFAAETGRSVVPVYGASGNLVRQIRQGAPFALFLSADEAFAERLVEAGLAEGPSVVYAEGRLVLFTATGSGIAADPKLADLARALDDGRLKHLAIANPDLAPYGRAAVQVLEAKGLLARARPKLVTGETIAQAGQFATSGAAEAAFLAYSLVLSPAVAERGSFALLPETLHAPIRQRMVLVKGAGPTAGTFFAYLQSAPARTILARWGYGLPGGG